MQIAQDFCIANDSVCHLPWHTGISTLLSSRNQGNFRRKSEKCRTYYYENGIE